MTAPVHEARALAYLARQDAGPPPADAQERADWRTELRAAHDDYRAGRAIAVGVDRLDTVRRAVRVGRYDACGRQDLTEALAAVEHGCMSYWRTTPYGLVWIDNEFCPAPAGAREALQAEGHTIGGESWTAAVSS